MAWLVIADDAEGAAAMRGDADLMAAMWRHELAHLDRTVLAGSLREDDRETKTGSVFLLDVETRAEAEAILAADPATAAGMRGRVEMRWLNVAILGGAVRP